MIWLIVFPAVFWMFLLVSARVQHCRIGDLNVDAGFASFMAVSLGVCFAFLVGSFLPKEWSEPEIVPLASLYSTDGPSGSIFLGTGSVGEKQYYFYYKRIGNGSEYQPESLEINDNVTIREEERTDGQLNIHSQLFFKRSFWWFGFFVPRQHYNFVIPKESLQQNFRLS